MLTLHTPSPWKLVKTKSSLTIRNKSGCTLATVHTFGDGTMAPQAEPNGNLMTAAPELLEALIIARSMIQKSGISFDNADSYNVIDKAIKKALKQ